MAKDDKPYDKKKSYKHRMMRSVVDSKYAQAREENSAAIKETADRMKAKLAKSVRTFKFKRARTRREIQRENRRRPLQAKLLAIDDESDDDPIVSSDSTDYDIFGEIHSDSNPSDDDDNNFGPAGAGAGGIEAN